METLVGCAIILYNKNETNKILLAKRSNNKKLFPNYWELPGGAIEAHEAKEDCIIREIKEELNLEIQNLNFIFTDMTYNRNQRHMVFLFEGYCNFEKLKLEPYEIEEVEFVDIDEIKMENIFPGVMDQIEKYKNHKELRAKVGFKTSL